MRCTERPKRDEAARTRAALRRGLRVALPADAAVPRRRARGLCHAVLVGRDQGDGAGRVLRRRVDGAGAPMSLAQAVTYTWLAQGLLALLPWVGDPEVALAVRTGAVAYDRLRPVDAYALWFARSAGWIAARVLPRAALMVAFAAIALPLAGLGRLGLAAAGKRRGRCRVSSLSAVLALLLSAAMVMLLNIAAAAALNERGINALAAPVVIVFSGNLLPLALLPDCVADRAAAAALCRRGRHSRAAVFRADGRRAGAGRGWGCSASGLVALVALGHRGHGPHHAQAAKCRAADMGSAALFLRLVIGLAPRRRRVSGLGLDADAGAVPCHRHRGGRRVGAVPSLRRRAGLDASARWRCSTGW